MIKPKPRLEDTEQQAVIRFIRTHFPTALFCSSNGGVRTSWKQAKKMVANGYVAGFPDLFIYEPNAQFKGLAIEMKRTKGGKVSPEQKWWQDELNKRGYKAIICYGAIDAIKEIMSYFR